MMMVVVLTPMSENVPHTTLFRGGLNIFVLSNTSIIIIGFLNRFDKKYIVYGGNNNMIVAPQCSTTNPSDIILQNIDWHQNTNYSDSI